MHSAADAVPGNDRCGVLRLVGVGRTVADLPAAIAFYRDALGLALLADVHDAQTPEVRLLGCGAARIAWLALGAQRLQLVAFRSPGRAMPPDGNCADLWFQHIAVVSPSIEAAWRRVRAHAVMPLTRDGPQRLPEQAGGVTAFKFRDPEGHPVELIHFPGSWPKDPPQAPGDLLTAGIDHSAIAVADTDRSVGFYTQVLGLHEAAQQINRGIEQARLDDLPDPVVDVVALEPSQRSTPHIELLGYRTPRGRPAPDSRPNDLLSDRLILDVTNLRALVAAIAKAGCPIVSPGCVSLAGGHAALVRDPDGHLLELRERGAA